jgi:hypothetical protein
MERVTRTAGAGESAPAEPGRRSILRAAWLGLGLAALGETVWILGSFLRPRRRESAPAGSLVMAGPIDTFTPGPRSSTCVASCCRRRHRARSTSSRCGSRTAS